MFCLSSIVQWVILRNQFMHQNREVDVAKSQRSQSQTRRKYVKNPKGKKPRGERDRERERERSFTM